MCYSLEKDSTMIRINIKSDVEKLRLINDGALSSRQISIAVSRGINRTLTQGRTVARQQVKQNYNIPQRYLKGIAISRSAYNNVKKFGNFLTGNINASANPIPMDAFAPKFSFTNRTVTSISKKGLIKTKDNSRAKRMYGKGVTIEVQKGKKETIPYLFMLPGSARVFGRGMYKKGGASGYGFIRRHTRLANRNNNDSVNPMLSVTIHAAVINPKSEQAISSKIVSIYPKNIQHELDYILNALPK